LSVEQFGQVRVAAAGASSESEDAGDAGVAA
jgi:hypothetical protein